MFTLAQQQRQLPQFSRIKLLPNMGGLVGWSCYFKEVDKCIDLFSNHESGTESPASDENQPYKYLPYDNILNVISDEELTVPLIVIQK